MKNLNEIVSIKIKIWRYATPKYQTRLTKASETALSPLSHLWSFVILIII